LKDPEPPRNTSNLSPEPSPMGSGSQPTLAIGECRPTRVRASVVCSGW
jgi:hypothetical protein